MKKTLVALIFGCSAGFAVMFLYTKVGLPDTDTNSIKLLIAFIITMLIMNFRIVFLNNPPMKKLLLIALLIRQGKYMDLIR